MCNTAYNLKAVYSSLVFPIHFGCPFAVTACTHSNMSLRSGGGASQVFKSHRSISALLVVTVCHNLYNDCKLVSSNNLLKTKQCTCAYPILIYCSVYCQLGKVYN